MDYSGQAMPSTIKPYQGGVEAVADRASERGYAAAFDCNRPPHKLSSLGAWEEAGDLIKWRSSSTILEFVLY